MINDQLSIDKNEPFYIPKYCRTISIQSRNNNKLSKTLTTLKIEDDKDVLDQFSFLIFQTHFNKFSNQQQQLFPKISSEKAYINLLTMNYTTFIELT